MGGSLATPPATVTYSPNPLGITLSSGVQVWTVPITRVYKFAVTGAGANFGAVVSGSISLTVGQIVYCVVGQVNGLNGGGGSFVFIGTPSMTVPFIAAGGAGSGNGQPAYRTQCPAPLNLTGVANPGDGNGGSAGSAGSGGGNGGSSYACPGGGSGGGAYGIVSLLTNFSISSGAFGGAGVSTGSCTMGGGGFSGGGGGCNFAGGGGGGSYINNGGSTWTSTSIVQSANANGSIVIS